MTDLPPNILHRIGNTSLIPLRNIGPASGARILLKLESANPTGSMKDRMALAMIEAAEADGRLPRGGAVVEYTGGSTGVSLSLVCTVKSGLRLAARSTASSRASGQQVRCAATARDFATALRAYASSRSNLRSRLSCQAESLAVTGSTASEPVSSYRSGKTASPIGSSACRLKTLSPWRCASRAKKASSRALQPGRT